MAEEIVYRITTDSRQSQEALDDLERRYGKVEEVSKKTSKETQKGLDLTGKAAAGAAKSFRAFEDSVVAAASKVEILGVNLGSVAKGLVNFRRGIVATGKAARVAVASTGIGLLLVALGSLATLLTTTQGGLDFLTKTVNQASFVFDVLVTRVGTLGKAITQLFEGDWRGAFETARSAARGLGDELSATLEDANEKTRIQIELEELQIKNTTRLARLNQELAEARNIAADVEGQSLADREAAARRALQINEQITKFRLEEAELANEIAQIDFRNSRDNREDQLAAAEAEARLLEVRGEELDRRRELITQLGTIQREQASAAAAALKKQQAEQKELNRLQRESLEVLEEFTRLSEREAEAAALEVEALDGLAKLRIDREKETAREIDEIKQNFYERQKERLEQQAADAEAEQARNRQAASQLAADLGGILSEVGNVYSDLISKNTELQQATKSRLQELLSDEESVSAEQVALERQRLAALEDEQRKYLRRQEALAAIESSIQRTVATANLIAGITKNFANADGGLSGLGIALTTSAILGAIATASRSLAQQFQAFATGTEYVDGPGGPTTDSIPARLSRGERVLTARQNQLLGGRRISNDDLVNYALAGMGAMVPAMSAVPTQAVSELKKNNELLQQLIRKVEGQNIAFNVDERGIYAAVQRVRSVENHRNRLRR